jgi:hypothetical protein
MNKLEQAQKQMEAAVEAYTMTALAEGVGAEAIIREVAGVVRDTLQTVPRG